MCSANTIHTPLSQLFPNTAIVLQKAFTIAWFKTIICPCSSLGCCRQYASSPCRKQRVVNWVTQVGWQSVCWKGPQPLAGVSYYASAKTSHHAHQAVLLFTNYTPHIKQALSFTVERIMSQMVIAENNNTTLSPWCQMQLGIFLKWKRDRGYKCLM